MYPSLKGFAFTLTPRDPRSKHHAFTLIELLVVIAIVAILSITVLLTLSPAELLRQSRDATRLSDLDTLNRTLSLYVTDFATQGASLNLGNASTVYVSLIDTASSTCGSLGLPALPTGYIYHCSSATSSRNTDTTGWIPVNLKSISSGSPLGSLPQDPTNQSSTNLYYTYLTDGQKYELTAFFESGKYAKAMTSGGPDPALYAIGSNLNLPPLGRGLVGYWPMDEGGGGPVNDFSNFGNLGTWGGTPTGTNGYYSQGRIGMAGAFDGTSTYVSIPDASVVDFSGDFTLAAWIKTISAGPMGATQGRIINKRSGSVGYELYINQGGTNLGFFVGDAGGYSFPGSSNNVADANWHHVVAERFSSSLLIYTDGSVVYSGSTTHTGNVSTTVSLYLGMSHSGGYVFPGLIDDVRLYNRALSLQEIQEIYNAEK